MHEENKISIRHSYRASRVPKFQLNVAIEHVGKIPRICGGGGGGGCGGIAAASSGSSGDKDDEVYNFFHNGDDIGNDIGGFDGSYIHLFHLHLFLPPPLPLLLHVTLEKMMFHS